MSYFLSPKVLFGKGSLKRLGTEMEGKGSRAVLITDKTMVRHTDRLVETVKKAGFLVKIWDGAEQDPSIDVALAGSRVLLDFEPQWVIGFGGGSAIDTAKAAWVLYERPELEGKPILPKVELNLRKKARFLSVPTTSGTGADVTWVAVLTDTVNQQKQIFAHNDIVPDLSVLDAELTMGMPKELTASTGIDVLGHAVDGYTSKQQTDFSDGLCLQAMKMVFEWLPKACRDGSDLMAREKMQNAATIAGLGFGNSNTGLSHALAHSAGALYHIPHGRAVGIALPYSLEYISSTPPSPKAPDPVERLVTAAKFVGIDAGSDQDRIQRFIEKIRDLEREIGEPLSLKEAAITENQMNEGMDTLVHLANKDPNMFTTPCECKGENLRQLFRDMWKGV
ncbi:MAG: iron-containing alcohol dehydrogenase [Deltaproteobacteria bacterium]|nr:iron-containing alcohol dehydrogenase [Deltaproteobacteria bacterium]MBW2342589.1 iron-containing alcohol dehydrogenase [Deltaproteobacteria bacterium]